MITVPSRELKNRLGKYLRLVREGETVRITDRGNPVAVIVPLGREDTLPAPMVEQLLKKGAITLGTGQPLSRHPLRG
jgi:prevent-host-death family protein